MTAAHTRTAPQAGPDPDRDPPPGLLAGVRVIDMTNVLAGPFAGYQLALLGADVIKVEQPGSGDLARQLGADPELSSRRLGVSFLAQNAGKQSITVDLKNPEGKEVFARLLADADVLVENFRPGVLTRLGFSPEQLAQLNPRLVYCAISGFGATGPMRDRPAYDQVVQGLSGIMSVTGTPETAPIRVGFPVCDTVGGLFAATTISAALVQAARTGRGAYLDVSLLEAAVTSMGWVVSDHLIAGRDPVPMANENITAAPSGTFATGLGKLNIAANKQEQWEALCAVLERDELLTDPRFTTREARKAHRHELREELEKSLASRSAAEWDEVLLHTSVPAAPVVSVPDALELTQLVQRQLVHTVPAPEEDLPAMRLLGGPVHVDGRPSAPRGRPPRLGEHTDQILDALGYDQQAIADLRARGAV